MALVDFVSLGIKHLNKRKMHESAPLWNQFLKNSGRGTALTDCSSTLVALVSTLSYTLFSPFRRLWVTQNEDSGWAIGFCWKKSLYLMLLWFLQFPYFLQYNQGSRTATSRPRPRPRPDCDHAMHVTWWKAKMNKTCIWPRRNALV